MLHTYQFWKRKQVMCLLCVYAVCNQHSVQAYSVKKEAVFLSCYVLPSPTTWTCTHSIENAAYVSVLEAEASHVLIMRLCSLPPAFSTSMLCKERDTTAIKCSQNFVVLRVLLVATMYAVCLILYRDACFQVLSRQQSAGRCTSCAKWPCNKVFPCLSYEQADNAALCDYAVKY